MFAEPTAAHHRPHFHAYYRNEVAIVAVDVIEVIGGGLPRRQQRLVEAWAKIHQVELSQDWDRLQAGRPPLKTEPLT